MNKIAMYEALLGNHPLWEKTANPMALAAGLGGLAGGAAGGLSGGEGFDAKKALIGAGIGAAGGAGIRHGMNVSAAKNLAKTEAAAKATADAAKKSRNETGAKIIGGLGALGAAVAGGRAIRKGTETGAKLENALSRGAAIGREGLADIGALTGAVNKAAPELQKGVASGQEALAAAKKTVADAQGLRDNVVNFIRPAANKTAMYQGLLEDHHLWIGEYD